MALLKVRVEPTAAGASSDVDGIFDDEVGLEMLDRVGVSNITFETDYPHSDSTWPHTKEVAEKLMGHLPDDVIRKLVRGNAIEMLGLDLEP